MEKGMKPAKRGTGKANSFRMVLNVLLLMALLIALSSSANAGDKIKIRLHQPPPNKLGAGDLWKLDITNSTKENINIYLTGTAAESKKGLIVSGKSKVITVNPGTKRYDYNDFKSGEVNWKDKSIQEVLLRTGSVPEGEYTICVTAFYENNEIADQENCIEQVVRQQGSINLVSPEDGKELDPDTLPGLMFAWTPLQGGGDYDLVIVEIRGEQSEDIALKENHTFFEKKGLNMTSYQYSLTDPKFEKGKKYAWQVTSGAVNSEAWGLTFMDRSLTQGNICVVKGKIRWVTGSADFGDVQIGQTRTNRLNILNNGTIDLVITPASLGAPFSFTTAGTFIIPPSGSVDFDITFAPTILGPVGKTWNIYNNAAPFHPNPFPIPLIGTGLCAGGVTVVSPLVLHFGNRTIGVQCSQIIQIKNHQGSCGDLTFIPSLLPGSSDFSLGSSFSPPYVKTPGDFENITVYYTPTAGFHSQTWTINNNSVNRPGSYNITIDGTGITQAAINMIVAKTDGSSVSPISVTNANPTINFGNVPLNTPKTLIVRISNTLPISPNLLISNWDPIPATSPFELTLPSVPWAGTPISIAQNNNYTEFYITFTPTVLGTGGVNTQTWYFDHNATNQLPALTAPNRYKLILKGKGI